MKEIKALCRKLGDRMANTAVQEAFDRMDPVSTQARSPLSTTCHNLISRTALRDFAGPDGGGEFRGVPPLAEAQDGQ